PDRPAEPHAWEERLRGRSGLQDDVGPEAPEARRRDPFEAELPVRDVLDDEESVATGELDERPAPLADEADAGRILVVGDRIEELRAQPTGEPSRQLFHVQAP